MVLPGGENPSWSFSHTPDKFQEFVSYEHLYPYPSQAIVWSRHHLRPCITCVLDTTSSNEPTNNTTFISVSETVTWFLSPDISY
jgi:hypothetical protein